MMLKALGLKERGGIAVLRPGLAGLGAGGGTEAAGFQSCFGRRSI